MPDPDGWLAIATVVLALATVWLARESRQDRIDQRKERERRLLRAALLEQLDNCRQWLPSAATLDMASQRPSPAVARLSDLLDGLTLPADLTLFLTWARAEIGTRAARHDLAIVDAPDQGPIGIYNNWYVVGDVLQEVTCLLRAHARALQYGNVADGLPMTRWEIPQPAGTNDRTLQYDLAHAEGRRPSWPSGEPYESCGPAARDKVAAGEQARQQEVLTSTLSA